MTIVIGIIGPPVPTHWRREGIELTSDVTGRKIDGLVSWGAEVDRFMLDFAGPKVWYSDEPLWFIKSQKSWREAGRRLADCFLHHSQPDEALRVRSVTHYGALVPIEQPTKSPAAVAVASKFGGRIWWLRGKGLRLRNRFLTAPSVDLYGNPNDWSKFRRYPWSYASPPANYRGELNGSWLARSQLEFLSRFRAVVCLENAIAENYFTEKFVNAALAGSIPVYHANIGVRDTVLRGARWIDPADFDFDPARTVEAALRADLDEIRSANFAWLKTPSAEEGDGCKIWDRVLGHLLEKLGCRTAAEVRDCLLSALKNWLGRTPLAWAVRRTRMWRRARGQPLISPEKRFYQALIDREREGSILDVGANIGSKSEHFMTLAANVIAVEPDPDMATTLRRRFRFAPQVQVIQCAVSDHSGVVRLFKFDGNEAFNTVSPSMVTGWSSPEENHMHIALPTPTPIDVPATTLAALLKAHAPIKYAKIDAEGHEWEIISTLDRPVPLISLEFSLPRFATSLEASLKKLCEIDPGYRFNAAIAEPPETLVFDRWLEAHEILQEIRDRGWPYVEIYARLGTA